MGSGGIGTPWGVVGSPWDVVGTPWGVVGSPWDVVGSSWDVVGTPWGVVGSPWDVVGTPWGEGSTVDGAHVTMIVDPETAARPCRGLPSGAKPPVVSGKAELSLPLLAPPLSRAAKPGELRSQWGVRLSWKRGMPSPLAA